MNNTSINFIILSAIAILAFSIRLFSIVRWESVIHEYDPYFNYRTTKFLSSWGFEAFLNWFDDRSWYPLGRIVGGTIYPGLMITASSIQKILFVAGFFVNIRNICVLLAPLFASFTSILVYLLTYEVTEQSSTSILASALMAMVPAYISRSSAGSYDNEAVAIFALVLVAWRWLRALRSGSTVHGAVCAMSFAYMVCSWGGYVLVGNLIPAHVAILMLTNQYSSRLYIAYCSYYVIGTLLAMQVPFVGFNVFYQAEGLLSHSVFVLLQAYSLLDYVHSIVANTNHKQAVYRSFYRLVKYGAVAAILLLCLLQLSGRLPWSGRSLTLLDPTYASKYLPIVASVSEHQPSSWGSFYTDFGPVLLFCPLGLYFLFENQNEAKLFIILYTCFAFYFAGIMIRLMLTLAPIVALISAIGLSGTLQQCFYYTAPDNGTSENQVVTEQSRNTINPDLLDLSFSVLSFQVKRVPAKLTKEGYRYSIALILGIMFFLVHQVRHCSSVSSRIYSSPSIIFPAINSTTGTMNIRDDLREAYYWIRQNTHANSKIMSWWDYGYQLSSMSNRTVLVDNNTWNNTHIATVGLAFASNEKDAYPILQSLDVDYVLVFFGGYSSHGSDDINKFPWFVRIAQGVFPGRVNENDFLVNGRYVFTGDNATDAMKSSVLHKLSYYRFNEVTTADNSSLGFDRVRNIVTGNQSIQLQFFEESFTSTNWIVRIYRIHSHSYN